MPASIRLAAALLLSGLALPAAAEGTLDKLKASGEIHLGYRADAAPLSYAGGDGLPAGYTVDVCEAVAELLGTALGTPLKPSYVLVTAEDRFDAVADGRVDLLCEPSTVTLTRREQIDFSIPTFVDGAAVLLPKGASPELSALAGKKVGVVEGTTTEDALRNTLAATKTDATIVPVASHEAGIAALEAGTISAYFGDQAILFHLLATSDKSDALSISDNTLTVEKQALGLPLGDGAYRLAVDRALSELYHTGRMVEIFKANLPGAKPGPALSALFLLAPELP
ncbi:amino acid ABC transporter substrate-binding protein [Amaricoccus sp.]|uniref:amino acid ABC transporter substrate-binding protein n=1 Tax=Amaricoccus sp. TaxID=1872485 RepID=UPI00261C1373|nr:amino acid ABC transporter substrate-binding protein [uncultured Amaricoccus sp.]